jgi:hypothetical protein
MLASPDSPDSKSAMLFEDKSTQSALSFPYPQQVVMLIVVGMLCGKWITG